MRLPRLLVAAFFVVSACTVDLTDWRGRACDPDHPCAEGRVCSAEGRCVDPGNTGGGSGGGVGGGTGGGVGGGAGGGGGAGCDPAQLGLSCTVGQGICEQTGVYICEANQLVCDATIVPAGTEVCDGLDNDCDGVTDNNLTPPACSLTLGVCASAANTRSCQGDGGFSDCVYPSSYEQNETSCDGLDNDCDGITDEVTDCLYTVAGSAPPNYTEGTGPNARFATPQFLTLHNGEILFGDRDNHVVRAVPLDGGTSRLVAGTPGVCGFQEGSVTSAKFCAPIEVVATPSGDLYVSDAANNRIRKISNGIVSTLAGSGAYGYVNGTAATAAFKNPYGLFLASNGDLLIADNGNNRIRRWIATSNQVALEAGAGGNGNSEGTRTTMQFASPMDMAIDSAGNLYTSEESGDRIRVIGPGSTAVSANLAGDPTGADGYADGTGSAASFSDAMQLSLDEASGVLYVADRNNRAVRSVTLDAGVATTYLRAVNWGFSNGVGSNASSIAWPGFVNVSPTVTIVADEENHVLRRIDRTSTSTWQTSVIGDFYGVPAAARSSDGPAKTARSFRPFASAIATDGTIYFTEPMNDALRRITPSGNMETVIGNVTNRPRGFMDGAWSSALLDDPTDVAFGPDGKLYVLETATCRIRQVDTAAQTISLYAGPGSGSCGTANGTAGDLTTARFDRPSAIAFGRDINTGHDVLYVSDEFNWTVRAIDRVTDTVSVFAGVVNGQGTATPIDGPLGTGKLYHPKGLAQDGSGNVWIADNDRVRKIAPDGTLSTPYAPLGFTAESVAIDGDALFVVGGGVAKVQLSTGNVTTFLSKGGGYQDGYLTGAARYYYWNHVVAKPGYLLLTDTPGGRIRQLWR